MDEFFDIEIKVCRAVLTIFGLWPCTAKDVTCEISLRFAVLLVVMIGFCNIPQTLKLFDSAGNFDEILEIITNCDLTMLLSLIKTLTIWCNREALHGLLASMAHDWKMAKTQAEKLVMQEHAKLSHLTSMMLFWVGECAVLALLSLNAYNRVVEWQLHSRVNASERTRPLYLLSKFPYDVQKSPYYEITWFCQFLSTLFGASIFTAVDGFFAALVLHLCAQMKLLRLQLKRLLTCDVFIEDYCCDLDISPIVRRHKHLLWFADSIEYIFNLQFLMQLISSCLIFCLTGYQIVLVLQQDVISVFEIIFAAYYYLGFASSLFIYCIIAMILSNESMKLGASAYDSNWYQLSPSDAKLLILIMVRTSRPVQLTAGKFVAFSLQLYCNVMKTSGGYLSVLLAVRNK